VVEAIKDRTPRARVHATVRPTGCVADAVWPLGPREILGPHVSGGLGGEALERSR
jgi:hypothetical protein